MKIINPITGLGLLSAAMLPHALVAAERDQTGDALARALAGKPNSGTSDTLRPAKANPCAALGAGFAAIPGSPVSGSAVRSASRPARGASKPPVPKN